MSVARVGQTVSSTTRELKGGLAVALLESALNIQPTTTNLLLVHTLHYRTYIYANSRKPQYTVAFCFLIGTSFITEELGQSKTCTKEGDKEILTKNVNKYIRKGKVRKEKINKREII